MRAHGWRVITRAEAAHRLRAAGYLLGTCRDAGHLLYEDEADSTRWTLQFAWVSDEAFVVREQAQCTSPCTTACSVLEDGLPVLAASTFEVVSG